MRQALTLCSGFPCTRLAACTVHHHLVCVSEALCAWAAKGKQWAAATVRRCRPFVRLEGRCSRSVTGEGAWDGATVRCADPYPTATGNSCMRAQYRARV